MQNKSRSDDHFSFDPGDSGRRCDDQRVDGGRRQEDLSQLSSAVGATKEEPWSSPPSGGGLFGRLRELERDVGRCRRRLIDFLSFFFFPGRVTGW